MSLDRRSFLKALFIAPAIIKTAGLLMPVKPQPDFEPFVSWFRQDSAIVPVDWRYGVKIAKIDTSSFLEGMSQRVFQTVVYGNSDEPPLLFNRFEMVKHVA